MIKRERERERERERLRQGLGQMESIFASFQRYYGRGDQRTDCVLLRRCKTSERTKETLVSIFEARTQDAQRGLLRGHPLGPAAFRVTEAKTSGCPSADVISLISTKRGSPYAHGSPYAPV